MVDPVGTETTYNIILNENQVEYVGVFKKTILGNKFASLFEKLWRIRFPF